MKKLMIALAAVAVAAGVQAANFEWSMGKDSIKWHDETVTKSTTGYHGSMSVYLFNVGSTGFDAAFISALEAGSIKVADLTSQTGYIDVFATGTGGTSSGKIAQNTVELGGFEGGETTYFAWIAYDTITGAAKNETYFYASQAQQASAWITGDELYTKDGAFVAGWTGEMYTPHTATPNNWHTVAAVPEPTSGLLLLLGVAGMALRRKHA